MVPGVKSVFQIYSSIAYRNFAGFKHVLANTPPREVQSQWPSTAIFAFRAPYSTPFSSVVQAENGARAEESSMNNEQCKVLAM